MAFVCGFLSTPLDPVNRTLVQASGRLIRFQRGAFFFFSWYYPQVSTSIDHDVLLVLLPRFGVVKIALGGSSGLGVGLFNHVPRR